MREEKPMIEMTNEMELRIYEALERRYGASGQITVAIEEMAELTQALTKWLRFYRFGGAGTELTITEILERIHEEIGDVNIMLSQLELMFGDTSDIQEQKLQKLYDKVKDMFDSEGNITRPHFLDMEADE